MTESLPRASGARELRVARLHIARALLAASIWLRNIARRLGAEGHVDPRSLAQVPARDAVAAHLQPTTGAVFRGFLVKDLLLSWPLIAMGFLIAGLALVLVLGGAYFAAFIAMFCAGAVPAAFLCMVLVFGERQERSHLFMLSLPISPARYLLAKVSALTIAYAVPWVVLGGAAVVLLARVPSGPGLLPYALIAWLFVLDQYCMLLAAAIVSQSAAMVAMIAFNVLPSFFFYYIGNPVMKPGAVAVWSPYALRVIAIELAIAAALFAMTLWCASRPRDPA